MTKCRFFGFSVVLLTSSLGTLHAQQTPGGRQTQFAPQNQPLAQTQFGSQNQRGLQTQFGSQSQFGSQNQGTRQPPRSFDEGALADETERELESALTELEQTHLNHIQVLTDLMNKVPPAARAGVARAIENSKRGMERAQFASQKARGRGQLRSASRGGARPNSVGRQGDVGGRPDDVGARGGRPDGVGGQGGRGNGRRGR